MLGHLFSSRTRVKLLSIFLLHPQKDYFVRELTRLTDEQINSVRRELENLALIGLLKHKSINNKKYYFLNNEFIIIEELKSIFNKLSDDRFNVIQEIGECGDIYFFAFSNGMKDILKDCDLLLVANIEDKEKFYEFIENLEKKHQREIKYVLLSKQEFIYRHSVHDQFLTKFFLSSPIILIDSFKFHW